MTTRARMGRVTAPLTKVPTPLGVLTVRPVDPGADLALLHGWMNDPAVARWWELDGPLDRLVAHLDEQLTGSHSRPYLSLLDGTPFGYWESYWAEQDRIAGHYPARPGDAGLHVLLGTAALRGVGLGWRLIEAVSAWQLAASSTRRVVAEPDVRNAASLRAFDRAGFRRTRDIELPEKTAALMVREPDSTPPGGVA